MALSRADQGGRVSKSYYMVKDRWYTKLQQAVVFGITFVVRVLTWPVPTPWLSGLAAWVSGRFAMAVPGLRRRALRNLDRVWPDRPKDERRAIARDAAAHFGRLGIEYSRLRRAIREIPFQCSGVEHLQDAKAAGKGAILVTAHYGNWEFARLAAKTAGVETGIIYRAFNNRYLDAYTQRLITSCGEPVLQKGRSGMRELVAHVRRGGFIMILVDQRNSGAPFLDFLGHPAETVTVAADLAAKTGAALIPTRSVRDIANNRFDVTFEPPIPTADPTAMMQQVNDRISAWITERPEQWLWFHRRWKSTLRSRTRPGEEA